MRIIDADYVLSKIGEYAMHPNEELVNNLAIAFDIVVDAPTIDAVSEWIPCSERLPEKSKQVMCCDKQGRVFTSAMTYINSNGEPSFGKHYGVIAWQPLPEPWKGADDE